MEKKIKSISEAFSIQPMLYRVCAKEKEKNPFDMEDTPHVHDDSCCIAIAKDFIQTGTGQGTFFYVGFDRNGDKMFECVASAMNVTYF